MYYRYRAKKKDRGLVKALIVIIFLIAGIYFVYNNRHELMFWRISQNRILTEINNAGNIEDPGKRLKALDTLAESMKVYREDNLLEPDAYIMSARVNYLRGMAETGTSFTSMYINDSFREIPEISKKYLLSAVKDLNRGRALLYGKDLNTEDTLILAKSFFLTGYYTPADIFSMMKSLRLNQEFPIEDIRFYIVMATLSGNHAEGLEVSSRLGRMDDTVQGRIFYASLLKDAGKYTESIMAFRNIVGSTNDLSLKKLSYRNLGQIYFKQRLYRESIEQFDSILVIDNSDLNSKIWLGKNYSALGNNDKARAIWSEVLMVNRSNEEVKKLLGLM